MDKRTKNRLQEHLADGHILMMTETFSKLRYDECLCVCSCSWAGWLDI